MKDIIKIFSYYNSKYNISVNARSISFYFISSIASITMIVIACINELNKIIDNSLYLDFLKIITNLYSILVSSYIERITINGFSLVLLVSIIYCFSKVIYSYKVFCKSLFLEEKENRILKDILGSILIVLNLILILLLNIILYLYSDKLIDNFFNNELILYILHFGLELLLLYVIIIFFYKIIIPKKIYLRNIKKESFAVSIIIYLILNLFVLFFNLLYVENDVVGITFILSMFSFLVFLVNYTILVGFIVINKKDNKVNNKNGGNNNEN